MALAESKSTNGERGFSLAETLVATALLATALVGTAQMFALSTRYNLSSRTTTHATVLAQEKMEQLRALSWGIDELGLPVSDFTTNLQNDPPGDDGIGLTPSPLMSLASNTVGYVDFLDPHGVNLVNDGVSVPDGTLYIRRWAVEPLPTNPNNTLVLQVFAFRIGARPDAGAESLVNRMPHEARLTSVKTRKAP